MARRRHNDPPAAHAARVSRRLVMAAAAVLCVVSSSLAAGCGGSPDAGGDVSRSLTKREYIERANSLQATAATVFRTLDGSTAPATPAAAAAHLAALDRLSAGFAELRPPRDWRREHATLVESLRMMRESMSTISRASAGGGAIVRTQLARYRAAQRDFEQAVRDINADR